MCSNCSNEFWKICSNFGKFEHSNKVRISPCLRIYIDGRCRICSCRWTYWSLYFDSASFEGFLFFLASRRRRRKKREALTLLPLAPSWTRERERERERLRRVWVTPRGVGFLVSRSPRCVCSQAPPARWPKGLQQQQQQQRLPWTFSAAWSPSQLHSPLVTSKERYKPSLERKSFVFIFFLLIF